LKGKNEKLIKKHCTAEQIEDLSITEMRNLMNLLPEAYIMRLYAKECTNEQLDELVKQFYEKGQIKQVKKIAFYVKKNHRPYKNKYFDLAKLQ